ncbi:tail fiber protein [Bacillus tianshenii]|nr:tail fiber protein [Bacillus tianshenii]
MEQYIGEIRMFSGNYAPQGWAFCDGQILPISQNEALYSLIGGIYGGDGRTTFALPDYRGRIPLHQGTNPLTGTTYNLGQKGGTETVTLIEQHLPSHTHRVAASSQAGTSNDPTNAVWSGSGINQYSDQTPDGTMSQEAITDVGGNQAHENMMPSLTISYIIALTGIYPQRS